MAPAWYMPGSPGMHPGKHGGSREASSSSQCAPRPLRQRSLTPSAVFTRGGEGVAVLSEGLAVGNAMVGSPVLPTVPCGGKCLNGSRAMVFSLRRDAMRSTSSRSSSCRCLAPLAARSAMRRFSLTSRSCFSERTRHWAASAPSLLFNAWMTALRSVISTSTFASIFSKRTAFSLRAFSMKSSSLSMRAVFSARSSSSIASISEWCCSSAPLRSCSCTAKLLFSHILALRSSASCSRSSWISPRKPLSKRKVASRGFSRE
mmetsp:Transcript_7477/g.20260  ORF Transcript_7477/g.20260 Transcript_7477/m.20260 type:complete len:260 (+) Transcript_7477:94-873(+)